MDIFVPVVICFILFVFFTLCGMCCKRSRDAGAVIATPVVITSTQHHVGPYPVSQSAAPPLMASQQGVVMQQHGTGTGMYPVPPQQPMPQSMPQPMPGYNPTGPGGYPPPQSQLPYPQQPQMPMPMPMPHGAAPPMMAPQTTMNPPSYDQVVTEGYARQAPFNPNYTGQ